MAAMAVLKPLAMIVCLSAGWRGGEFFPRMLTGACLGALTTVVLPISPAAAMVAGMAAATAMGLRKPVAAVLVVAFLAGGTALGPMVVGGLLPAIALGRSSRTRQASSSVEEAKPPRS
ncbi:MAG TPA: chloride channel protein [Tetrasphaera sp.]|uniref:chloride channel protein n=1 Tax=Nostocoides sp. TaxID=1917966 RepID=UPI002B8D1822|nr:chloride channel protein [Tetrasphaera sp.]HNQ07656.1 chloride channel protein [Tetrasphaera sp.]